MAWQGALPGRPHGGSQCQGIMMAGTGVRAGGAVHVLAGQAGNGHEGHTGKVEGWAEARVSSYAL